MADQQVLRYASSPREVLVEEALRRRSNDAMSERLAALSEDAELIFLVKAEAWCEAVIRLSVWWFGTGRSGTLSLESAMKTCPPAMAAEVLDGLRAAGWGEDEIEKLQWGGV